jgi:quercetin dioxygenase-like cupin family protein
LVRRDYRRGLEISSTRKKGTFRKVKMRTSSRAGLRSRRSLTAQSAWSPLPVTVSSGTSDNCLISIVHRNLMGATQDPSHLLDVERLKHYAARPTFRISEITIKSKQKIPWHRHSNIQDTFYVVEGHVRIFLRDPKEEVNLAPGETYSVKAKRPHLVTNGGQSSATFVILQGIGEYDFVPLT